MIYRNISNIWYSLQINREIEVTFDHFGESHNGLSPLFFVLAQHILSSNLKAQINDTQMNEYKVGRNDLNISHIFTWMTF